MQKTPFLWGWDEVAGKITPVDGVYKTVNNNSQNISSISHGNFELKMQTSAFFIKKSHRACKRLHFLWWWDEVAGKITPIDCLYMSVDNNSQIISSISHGNFELKMQTSAFFIKKSHRACKKDPIFYGDEMRWLGK